MKLTVVKTTGKNSNITVSDDLFAKKPNQVLLAQAVRVYLSNQRQGTSKTQTRSEVSRTTKKWYSQKGTGNARHGAKSANIFVGGAVAHGPRGIENWKLKLTTKLKKAALKQALLMQKDHILVNDQVATVKGKTKEAATLLNKIVKEPAKVLLVLADSKDEVIRSFRNLPKVMITQADRLNTLEVAMVDKIIITSEALKKLEARLVEK